MARFVWLRLVADRFFHRRPQRTSRLPHPVAARRRVRPGLEALEDRTVPAVFNVGAGDVATLIADTNAANSNGQSNVINLTASTYDLTAIDNSWYGPNGLPAITSNLTIHGNGAVIQRDPSSVTPDFRLLYVSGGLELAAGSLTMDNVTLEGGVAQGGSSNLGGGGLGAGGAIFNQGTLNLSAVTLMGNTAIGGSSGVQSLGAQANGGGGMGANADGNGNGGGFENATFTGNGGTGGSGGDSGGGGGGFLAGANGTNGTPNAGGVGGGLGGFGGLNLSGVSGDGGAGGDASGTIGGGSGGNFGNGGGVGVDGGGGGGVGGGGGYGINGGDGGFGGGGADGFSSNPFAGGGGNGGTGGFGGGGGGNDAFGGSAGFGGGNGTNGGAGGGGAGMGGAIFNMGADSAHPGTGRATLINCTLAGNVSDGGGVAKGNGGSGYGGAIFNLDGQVSLTNDTLAANTVRGGSGAANGNVEGGAVYNLAYGNDIDTGKAVTATLVLDNSILAVSNGGHDLFSQALNGLNGNTATITGSHNLVMTSGGTIGSGVIALSANPNLGPLQNNGGLTPTLLPLSGSPALGAGDPGLAPFTDQRGHARPANGPVDLGAVQLSGQSPIGGAGSSVGASTASGGFIGLAMEEFELTVDTVLAMVERIAGQPHAALEAAIAQLQTAIDNEPLTPTFMGRMAVFLGESAALHALNPQPLPPG